MHYEVQEFVPSAAVEIRWNKLFEKAKNSPEGVHKYRRARNKVVALMRSAKKEHFRKLNPYNVKQFWKSIKILNKYNSSIPTLSHAARDLLYSQQTWKKQKLLIHFSRNVSIAVFLPSFP